MREVRVQSRSKPSLMQGGSGSGPARIFVFPDPAPKTNWDKNGNPYPRFVMSGLAESFPETAVSGVSWRKMLSGRFLASLTERDVLLVHWPDSLLNWPFGVGHGAAIDRWLWRLPCNFWVKLKRRRFALWNSAVRKTAAKVLWVVHEITMHGVSGQREGLDKYVRQILKDRAAGLVVIERSTVPFIEDAFGSISVPVFWAPIGPMNSFHGPIVEKLSARQKLRVPFDQKVVLLLGTSRSSRSIVDLYEACKRTNTLLLVAGSGYSQDIDDEPFLKIMGFVKPEALGTVLSASDFIINHGSAYLNSAALRLALAYEKPVIAYSYGGAGDMTKGCRVELTDRLSLEACLSSLPKIGSVQYNSLVHGARTRNQERSWAECNKGFLAAIEGVLA